VRSLAYPPTDDMSPYLGSVGQVLVGDLVDCLLTETVPRAEMPRRKAKRVHLRAVPRFGGAC
jgi:hypothetical protein